MTFVVHMRARALTQMKLFEETPSAVNAAESELKYKNTQGTAKLCECRNCVLKHRFHKRKLCPAFSKTCNKCQEPKHFAAKCRSPKLAKAMH
jgi:hypothetical protein